MANPTDAREAFIQEVFGEILKVEKSVKETAAQVQSMLVELKQSEEAISKNTRSLIEAAGKLATDKYLACGKSKDDLKYVIEKIGMSTRDLIIAIRPLTDLTIGLKKVAYQVAEERVSSFLEKQERKIDKMLVTMDVFLQQIEVASERLPQLSTIPQKVSQINEGNIEYSKGGMDMRTFKRSLKNLVARVLKS